MNFINNEWGEIRDITFSCSVDQFMERPKFFAQVDVLSEGGGNELPHYALFIDNLPSVTGGMMVSSQCP